MLSKNVSKKLDPSEVDATTRRKIMDLHLSLRSKHDIADYLGLPVPTVSDVIFEALTDTIDRAADREMMRANLVLHYEQMAAEARGRAKWCIDQANKLVDSGDPVSLKDAPAFEANAQRWMNLARQSLADLQRVCGLDSMELTVSLDAIDREMMRLGRQIKEIETVEAIIDGEVVGDE